MLRAVLVGAIIAIAVLIFLWDKESLPARLAKGAALAYFVVVAVLFFIGLAV